MKNILIISPCDLPVPAVQGGAVQTLIDSIIIPNETKTTFKISVISSYNVEAQKKSENFQKTQFIFLKHNKLVDKLDNLINTIFGAINPSRKLRKCNFLWKLQVIKNCRRILLKNNYDAVILENNGYFTKIFESEVLMEKYEGKIFYHLHNDIPDSVNKKVVQKSKFILISKYLSLKIAERYGKEIQKNILILNNGINLKNYENRISKKERVELRKKFNLTENDKVVCFVGRINPDKGIMELLQAIQKIKDKSIKLLVIGATEFGNNAKSSFEERIKVLSESLKDRVWVTGYIPHEDVWKYYQIADLAVLPSIWEEPAGLTILEAMASKLPVITTNSGGIPEFMPKECGYILERDEYLIDNISKSIVEVCNNLTFWREQGEMIRNYVFANYSEDIYFGNFSKLIIKNDFLS